MKSQNIILSATLVISLIGGAADIANGQVDPNLPARRWCKVGESSRTHNCQDGSGSGAFQISATESGDPRGCTYDPAKKDTPKCRDRKISTQQQPVIIYVDSETCVRRGGRPLANNKCLLLPTLQLAIKF